MTTNSKVGSRRTAELTRAQGRKSEHRRLYQLQI
jgi:hypothetical protein